MSMSGNHLDVARTRARRPHAARPAAVRHWSAPLVGLGGTLLLHALMFEAMTLGAGAVKHRAPVETGPGASAIVSGADMSMTLVLVHLPGVDHAARLDVLASRGFAPADAAIQVISADPAPALAGEESIEPDEASEAPQAVGDPATQALLFGRYTGQINARIERAWLRPRSPVTEPSVASDGQGDEPIGLTPVAAVASEVAPAPGHAMPASMTAADASARDLFRCSARITQDTQGNVQEIELTACNGTLAWQQSLVQAIQHASPLPAPPSPTVFTNALTLTFEARAYRPGVRDEAYEPAGAQLARSETALSQHLARRGVISQARTDVQGAPFLPQGQPERQGEPWQLAQALSAAPSENIAVAPAAELPLDATVSAPALPFDAPLAPQAELTP